MSRYAIRGELSERRDGESLAALHDLRVLTYPVAELAEAIWELRDSLTAYDAAYLALARRLDVGLITLDSGLAKATAREERLVAL
jgi:predicted nucleic acid-binding protein